MMKFLACIFGVAIGAPIAVADPYAIVPVNNRIDHAIDRAGILYVTSGPDVVRFDLHQKQLLPAFHIGGHLSGIDLSPDSHTLAIADRDIYGGTNVVHVVSTETGADSPVSFALAFRESGTYTVVWTGPSQFLVSSVYAGSGWTPLRRYDLSTNTTQVVGNVRGSSLLAASADLTTVGVAEDNISSGPIDRYDVTSGGIVATINTNWYIFEVAVNPKGTQFFVPSYNGAFIFDYVAPSFQLHTMLGKYASNGPVGGVYSPVSSHLFTAEYDYSGIAPGVKVYDSNTLALLQSLDAYPFSWTGNGTYSDGRTRISPDGHWLAVSAGSNVRVYDVSALTNPTPTPSTPAPTLTIRGVLLACFAIICLTWFQGERRRRNFRSLCSKVASAAGLQYPGFG